MAEIKRRRSGGVPLQGGGQMPGYHVLKTNVRAELISPDWDKKPWPFSGHIVPAILEHDEQGRRLRRKQFMPSRDDHGDLGLTHWFYVADVAKNVGIGDDSRTFIVNDPNDDESGGVEATPYGKLFRRIERAVKNAAGKSDSYVICGRKKVNPKLWFDLLPGPNTKLSAQAFNRPGGMRTGFIPVLPLMDFGRLRFHEDSAMLRGSVAGDYAQILMVSGGVMGDIIKLAGLEVEDFNPDSEDITGQYVHGDFTRLDGTGKWLCIWNPNHHASATKVLSGNRAGGVSVDGDEEDDYDPSSSGGRSGGKEFRNRYSVTLVDPIHYPRRDTPDSMSVVPYRQAKVIARDGVESGVLENYSEVWDYFHLPETEEMCVYLATAFRSRRELIDYGWADDPEYFTDDVKGILAARTQAAAPGGIQDDEDEVEEDDDVVEDVNSIYDEEPSRSSKNAEPRHPVSQTSRSAKNLLSAAADTEEDDPAEDYGDDDGIDDLIDEVADKRAGVEKPAAKKPAADKSATTAKKSSKPASVNKAASAVAKLARRSKRSTGKADARSKTGEAGKAPGKRKTGKRSTDGLPG